MSIILSHLEARLGGMSGGWSVDLGAHAKKLTVCMFEGGEIPGVTAFATLGLSEFALQTPDGERQYYLELMGCQYAPDGGYGPFPGTLEGVATQAVKSGRLIRRGDVIDLPGAMAPGSEMVALYAALPVYFDDNFSSVRREDGRGVAIVWMIPIGATEADYVARHGWEAFESQLVAKDPDLLDLRRPQFL
ncbi:suppressor of fused domain protein [Streptomyces sp. NPDC057910]|uniref:suppressor of fused domain protein n=1 Tax=Streptomyces sp. NPDC057910 TaxID=3346278 RepID=UPI0036E44169